MTEEPVGPTQEQSPPAPEPGGVGSWLFGGWIGTLVVLLVLFAWLMGKDEGKRQADSAAPKQQASTPATTKAAKPPAAPAAGPGKELFATTCGGCHTLAAAESKGTTGPNLDELKPDVAVVEAAIRNGGAGSGAMPTGLAEGADAKQIADFVAKSVGG